MSPELKKFYQEIQLILKGKEADWFINRAGLCNNLKYYLKTKRIKQPRFMMLCDEMVYQFGHFKLADDYPFNFGLFISYTKDVNKYENPFRLYWINEMAKPEPEEINHGTSISESQ
jgi:hypothetical protein